MNGFVLINKPAGITSFDVIHTLRKVTQIKKIGHAGTLDPFATGLLIIGISRNATKHIDIFSNLDKTYTATLQLGTKTDTGDIEGKVIEKASIPILSKEEITKCLDSFVGKIEQIPPKFSAIKKNGKPLYKFARKGIDVKIEPRKVTVHSISLQRYLKNNITLSVKVSKGTYIRTLGEDIAQKLGTVGHLIELRRDTIGPFSVSEAISLDTLTINELLEHIHPFDQMLARLHNEGSS